MHDTAEIVGLDNLPVCHPPHEIFFSIESVLTGTPTEKILVVGADELRGKTAALHFNRSGKNVCVSDSHRDAFDWAAHEGLGAIHQMSSCCDINTVLIYLPTFIDSNGTYNVESYENICRPLAKCIANTSTDLFVGVRSTLLPGTTELFENQVRSWLNTEQSARTHFAYIPEYVPAHANEEDLLTPRLISIATHDDKAREYFTKLLSIEDTPVLQFETYESGEMAKLVDRR